MKRNRLLICILTLVSIVSVSSCYEEEGGFKYVDGAGAKGALDLLTENGASISSWTGVEASYVTGPSRYYNLDESIPFAETLDGEASFYLSYSFQALLEDQLTSLEYFRYNDLVDYNYQYYKYIDGENAYIKSQDELTYLPGEGSSYTLEYFTQPFVYLIEDIAIPLYTYYEENPNLDNERGDERTIGYLKVSRKGEHKGLLSVSFTFYGEDEYGSYEELIDVDSVFIYDKKGNLESFRFDYFDNYFYPNGDELLNSLTIQFTPFKKKITTPTWVESFNN